MKKILITGGVLFAILTATIVVYLAFIAPNFVGHAGAEGEHLHQYIEPSALKELTENPRDDTWIIDVRPQAAWAKGHIPTAKNFPSTELLQRLDEIPRDKYLIVYCETGGRAQIALRRLKKQGYTRYMNWGGHGRWPYEFQSQEQ
jgi:hydroxyacylglutathione hydrolase